MTDQKIFSTLEFGKIKQAVQHYLQTESAERLVQAMAPSDQLDIIQTWQSETEQALGILMQGKVLPIPRLVNIDMALKRLELGASLNGQELAGIAKLLSTIHQLMKFFDQLAAEEKTYPALTAWVYQVVTLPEIEAELAQAIEHAKKDLHRCRICQDYTAGEICKICLSQKRDRSVICVVESPRDIKSIERTHEYNGLYHVLHGLISPMDGIGAEQLCIKELLARLNDTVKEVIMATSPTVEGEATAMYLAKLIKPMGIKTTRLAYGLPVGSSLEYADETTLYRAMQGRGEL